MTNLPTHYSDRIDKVLLRHRYGIPIFLVIMYLMFWVTFKLGSPFVSLLELFFSWLLRFINHHWSHQTWPLLQSLVTDGFISGVGGVLVFVPNIILLFFFIALLEKSGAMGRAARVLDSAMDKVGLHGKSFVPLLMGFGCSVPAMMATSIVQNKRDRLATIFVIPLMSCSARFPIYMLFIPAVFTPKWHAPVLWAIYFFGLILALLTARVLSSTVLRHVDCDEPPIELIPWNLPTLSELFREAFKQAWFYIRKAGTVILGFSVLLWALSIFPIDNQDKSPAEKIEHSYAGHIGHFMEPMLKPAGMDWKIGTALIGAVAAKEVFVVQLGIVNSISSKDGENTGMLRNHVRNQYTPLSALCIMIFCLIGVPCMSSMVMSARMSESFKWTIFQFVSLTTLAWIVTVLIYQTGTLFMTFTRAELLNLSEWLILVFLLAISLIIVYRRVVAPLISARCSKDTNVCNCPLAEYCQKKKNIK